MATTAGRKNQQAARGKGQATISRTSAHTQLALHHPSPTGAEICRCPTVRRVGSFRMRGNSLHTIMNEIKQQTAAASTHIYTEARNIISGDKTLAN